ncbi:MAG: GTPase [Pirellulaceae bacterium]
MSARGIRSLIARAKIGQAVSTPFRVAIIGPPNVGKSSLMNRLLGFQRSIEFDQPGTTRDVLTSISPPSTAGWVKDNRCGLASIKRQQYQDTRNSAGSRSCGHCGFDSADVGHHATRKSG